MILYCNLRDVKVDNNNYIVQPTLKLTSEKLTTNFYSNSNSSIEDFCNTNGINNTSRNFLNQLLQEAKANNIEIITENIK